MKPVLTATAIGEMASYEGVCSVCGQFTSFAHTTRSVRESFQCGSCRASLRYRHQAEVLLAYCSHRGSSCLDELVQEPTFAATNIFEPGVIGPFRDRFKKLPGYVNSAFWSDVAPGASRNGIRCENLEALTFENESIDLIVSSDILEHVRRPEDAFRESFRVLKQGGLHVFTVPFAWPLAERTVARVDTTGEEDLHLLEPRYHGDPLNPEGSLVYNDFGLDIAEQLASAGFSVRLPRSLLYNLTVVALKP